MLLNICTVNYIGAIYRMGNLRDVLQLLKVLPVDHQRLSTLQQNSTAWKNEIINRITASETPAVLGKSPHTTTEIILGHKKRNVEQPIPCAMQFGIDDEAIVAHQYMADKTSALRAQGEECMRSAGASGHVSSC